MIQESIEWKSAIKRNNQYIRRYAKIALQEGSNFPTDRIQMRISSNALFCRRLLETPKVGSEYLKTQIPVTVFPWKGPKVCESNLFWHEGQVDYMNNHKIDEKYELNRPNRETIQAPVLGDYIIHSFVWCWGVDDEQNIDSFFVSSDRTKNTKLYQVDLKIYLSYLQSIANSSPAHISMHRVVSPRKKGKAPEIKWEWTASTPDQIPDSFNNLIELAKHSTRSPEPSNSEQKPFRKQ